MIERRLDIAAMGVRGEGIAMAEGRSLHVPGTLPGETVRAEVADKRGRLLAIERASPERVAPFCPHFGACGGCQLQHWQEQAYRRWKRSLVVSALERVGVAATVAELVDAHGEGRRRASLHVRKKRGRVEAGFMASRSHDLHDIDRCPVLAPALARAPDIARALGERLGDCDVALTASLNGLDVAIKVERGVAEADGLASLVEPLDLARLSLNGEVVAQRSRPVIAMGRARVALPPGAFLQATEAGEETLARLVAEAVGPAKRVADLFCGLGPFALRLAERARLDAFDGDKAAIAALGEAARNTTGFKPIATSPRDLFRAPLTAAELSVYDAAILDPPRAGAEAQARQLARSKVPTVVMVSCDPASLARDAAILTGGGYTLAAATPVDQFKWTSHVETVAVFRR